MTKAFLIATVAAFAITAPAQAQRGDRQDKKEERAQKAERAKEQRVERQRPQQSERARSQRAERQRTQRVERQRSQQVERQRPPRAERAQAQRIERQREQRAERIRAQRVERQRPERAERAQTQRVERQREQHAERARAQRAERQRSQQVERQRPPRAERAQAQRIERQRQQRAERIRAQRVERQRPERAERAQAQRIERQRSQRVERAQAQRMERHRIERRADRNRASERVTNQQQRQAERIARLQERIERRNDRLALRAQQRTAKLPSRRVGDRVDLARIQGNRDWFDNYAARRYASSYQASPQYAYDYDDGYLYQINRQSNQVTALYPILGGAISVGQAAPVSYGTYNSNYNYNVPYTYRTLYYDTPNYDYRYGDGAIYRVDQGTQIVQAIVALLSGQNLAIGQRLPMGYDVYNVPIGYRDLYRDRDDMWYRYDDGYIYAVDPRSRMIQSMYPVSYGGYMVGQPVPSYTSYGGYTGFGYGGYPSYSAYNYDHLYYSQPGYNYHYANNGIYQVDPTTQLVSALVALVTGMNLGVGQTLPMGYDVYNVPTAYRASYFDTPNAWYRYDDGYIYQVDPGTRLIQAQIPVSYDGYQVGHPVPAAYPGYAVPAQYDDLYYAQPGYDYRYFDGGIYAIEPDTRIVHSQVALLTGQTFGVGQMLPVGYDVYNLPMDYRSRYYDSPTASYRYADGYIYQVDPTTRLIQAVIDAVA